MSEPVVSADAVDSAAEDAVDSAVEEAAVEELEPPQAARLRAMAAATVKASAFFIVKFPPFFRGRRVEERPSVFMVLEKSPKFKGKYHRNQRYFFTAPGRITIHSPLYLWGLHKNGYKMQKILSPSVGYSKGNSAFWPSMVNIFSRLIIRVVVSTVCSSVSPWPVRSL